MPRSIAILFFAAFVISMAISGRPATGQTSFVAPQSISRGQPAQPTNRDGAPVEGWAIVRYSVLGDGTTADVYVTDIVPAWVDPAATIAAVEAWTFTPATQDGEAIDWYNNESVVAFRSPDGNRVPSTTFDDAYNAIVGMIEGPPEEGRRRSRDEFTPDLVGALTANQELLNRHAMLVEEHGLALLQAAIIYIGLNDDHSAYRFTRLATDPRIEALFGADLFVALQMRIQIEGRLGRVQDALATHERLAAGFGPDETNPFAGPAETLRNDWATNEILRVFGRIEDGPWEIDAGRRIFSIDDINGSVTSIVAECDSRKLTLQYQPDVDWAIPDSLGDCALFVHGEPGTRFAFFSMLPADE